MNFTSSSKIIIACLYFGVLLSCESQKEKQTAQFQLEITDSVKIAYPGLLNLMDIRPANERILLHDFQRGLILMTDFNGDILLELDKSGDQKGSYGNYLWSPASVDNNDHISLVSFNGFFEFDAKGNLVENRPFEETLPSFSGRASADSEIIEHEGLFYQKGLVAWGKYNKTDDEYYEQFQLLVKFDPDKGTAERIINLEPESLFRTTGRAYEIPEMLPSFCILDDELLVIAGTDPYLNIYEATSPHRLLERKRIEFEDYHAGEGKERAIADPKSIAFDESAGRTHTLKTYNNFLLATYFPGYGPPDRDAYNSIQNGDDYRVFKESIEGKYASKLLIMDHQGNALQSLDIPERLDHRQFLVRDGELWWFSRMNMSEEEDFVTVYRVELTEENTN